MILFIYMSFIIYIYNKTGLLFLSGKDYEDSLVIWLKCLYLREEIFDLFSFW